MNIIASRSSPAAAGFSLVSLLVGTLISALILTALIDFVLSQNRFAYSLSKQAEQSARQLQLAEQLMSSVERAMNRSCLDFAIPSPLLTLSDDKSVVGLLVAEPQDRAYWQLVSDQVRLYSSRKLAPGDWLVSPYCGGAELAIAEPPLPSVSNGFYRYDLGACSGQRENCLYRNQQTVGELVFLRKQQWLFTDATGQLSLREHRHPWRQLNGPNQSSALSSELVSTGGATSTIGFYAGAWDWAWYDGDWLHWRYDDNTVSPQLIAMQLKNDHGGLQLMVGAPAQRRVWPQLATGQSMQLTQPIQSIQSIKLTQSTQSIQLAQATRPTFSTLPSEVRGG
ncbi:PilW family protein [Umboniibacter marinipuniceus]|uniref:Uncharacterized protein n=1 Tax=Umboniibacter marinipuniceus TaxID=569599 RepID=A0A3M0A7F1_9GAMM|nr:hypothetical protein [Umboniibacter marinipuniceus]RMA78395.1 hypothetical protein DFR27_2326 [Umboniibacter marinipuniceus]